MSDIRDTNRQSSDSSKRKGSTNRITRRGIVIGATALGGLATVGIKGSNRAQAQQPKQTAPNQSSSMGRLNGKVALITGAARGIGRATALTLAREGADIIAIDLERDVKTVPYPMSRPEDLAEVERLVKAMGRRCLALQGDTRDMPRLHQIVAQGIAQLGKIDIAFANAGVASFASLETMTDDEWSDTININLTGTANTLRAVIPHMVSRKQGRLIATSSEGGRRSAGPGLAAYCATKWGIIGLIKTAAQELAKYSITANAICPGTVRTGMTQNQAVYRLLRPDLKNPTMEDATAALLKINTEGNKLPIAWIEPEVIANAVLHLASDEGRYVTGTALDVTAGTSASYGA